MGEVKIVRATFGDEVSTQNVTKSLTSKLSGGTVDIPVDSSLLPMFQVGGKIELTTAEKNEIKKKAEEVCGNANDTACIQVQEQNLQRQALQEKENATNSTANVVKGRRLTVTVQTSKGEKTFVIPEGQRFQLGDPKSPIPELREAKVESPSSWGLPTLGGTALEVAKAGILLVTTFFYVFTVIATWRTFLTPETAWSLKYAMTAIAVMFPGSGLLIVIGWSALREWKSAQ